MPLLPPGKGYRATDAEPICRSSMNSTPAGGQATARPGGAKQLFTPAMHILDLGCGIGGPSRYHRGGVMAVA